MFCSADQIPKPQGNGWTESQHFSQAHFVLKTEECCTNLQSIHLQFRYHLPIIYWDVSSIKPGSKIQHAQRILIKDSAEQLRVTMFIVSKSLLHTWQTPLILRQPQVTPVVMQLLYCICKTLETHTTVYESFLVLYIIHTQQIHLNTVFISHDDLLNSTKN